MKNFCIRRGKCVSAALILCLNFIAMPAYGELLKKSGHEHGTTTLYLPQNLCNVRINNLGEITGTCNRISVAHSDSGAFCAKVNSVQVILNGALANHFVKPTRMPNLCNFNVNDVWFDPIFPIQNADYQTSEIARLYSKVCRDTGRNGTQILTKHPMFDQGVNLVMGYGGIDGPRFYNEWHSIPPVNLTCDPCAQLAVKDSLLVPPNQLVSIQDHSIVAGGGIAPYIINFSVLPPGLFHQGYVITGRAAPGVYNSTVTVTDSCRSANNSMTKNIQFIVKDPPRILSFNLSPSTFNSLGGNVTASVKASSDVGVGEARLIITRPDGTQTAIPRIPYNAATGEYSYSWILPGNSTSSPMTFGVQARVYDTGGTMTGSQVISVTVPAKAADTLRLPVPTLMPRFP